MVRTVGWVPTTRGDDPECSILNKFVRLFDATEDVEQDYPMKRSGHRCFTDNDYFYLIGGYYTNERAQGRIFKELWVMSLATFEWRRYDVNGEFPESLASFAIVQIAPYSNAFLLFGGSGTAFGDSSSNSLYLVQVNNDDCVATSRKLEVEGEPPRPMYGHAMCAGEMPGKYYIVGGTEGNVFNFDVFSVTMKTNPAEDTNKKFTWHYQCVSRNEGLPGRYRLEVSYDEATDSLFFFGGGNSEEVFGFDKIVTLNAKTLITSEISAIPDQVCGFPKPRRCHTIVRYKRKVILSGGVATSEQQEPPPQFSDVWIFNMDDFSWTKSEQSLPNSVFFHDSVITEDGWMFSFGGVHGIQSDAPRNNMLVAAWFDVPRLQRFAMERLRSSHPKLFSGLYCGNFRPSNVLEIVTAFLRNGRIEEKEKQIIEQKHMRFFEKSDRSRHYLNENGANYVVYTNEDNMNGREFFRRRFMREFQQELEENPNEEQNEDENEEDRNGIRDVVRRVFDHLMGRPGGMLMMDRDAEEESDSGESMNGENADNERRDENEP